MTRKVTRGSGGLFGGGSVVSNTPDTLRSRDTIEFTLGVCEGPIAGLWNGPKTFYLDDTPLVSKAGNNNFDSFELHTYAGDPNASVIVNALGGTSSSTAVGVTLTPNTPVVRNTPPALSNTIDRLEVRLVFSQLFQVDAQGNQAEATARFKIQYRQAGSTTWLDFFQNPIISLTGKTTSTYVKEFVKRVPRISGDWEIQVVRVSPNTDPNFYLTMTWESFQCVTVEQKSYPNLAVVKGMGVGTDQFSSVPKFSGVWAGKLIKVPSNYDPVTRVYTGVWDGTFKLAHSDNPAWCAYDLLTDSVYGVKAHYPNLQVDRFSFYEGAQWCDELVPRPGGGFQPRYTYNDLIKEPRPALEMVQYIVALFGGVLSEDLNGTVVLKVDKPGSPVMIFGPESVTEDGFVYSKTDITTRVNDIEVEFINPELDWNRDVRRVSDQALITKNGRINMRMPTVGCIDVYEAQRRAMLRLISANTEVMMVSFATTRQGLLLEPFDLIGISDSDMNWGASGRVQSAAGTQIFLRDQLYLPQNSNLNFEVQTPSGIHSLTVQNKSGGAYTNVLTIVAGTLPADLPAHAQFTLSDATSVGLVKPFRILSIQQDETVSELYHITAIEVNVNKYGDADNMASTGTVQYSFVQSDIPAAPTNVVVETGDQHILINPDGQIIHRLFVSWDIAPRSMASEFEVFYRRKGLESFQSQKVAGTTTYISNIQPGAIYEVYVVAINATGRRSPKSALVSSTAGGKITPPSDVTSVTTTQVGDDVVLSIALVPDADLKHYLIREGSSWATGTDLGVSTDGHFVHANVRKSPLQYWIKSVDTSGNQSATAYGITHNVPAPATPTLSGRFVGNTYLLEITKGANDQSSIQTYRVKDGATVLYEGPESSVTIDPNWTGAKTLSAFTINQAGVISPAATITVSVSLPQVTALSGVKRRGNLELSWSVIKGSLPIDEYRISSGATELARIRGTTYQLPVDWTGTRAFSVEAIDIKGNIGPAQTWSDAAPSLASPTGWTGKAGFDTITLEGPVYVLDDFKAFRIYGATSATATTWTLVAETPSNHFTRRVTDNLTAYKISVIDGAGNESPRSVAITVTPVAPKLTDLDPSVSTAINNAAQSASADKAAAQAAATAAQAAETNAAGSATAANTSASNAATSEANAAQSASAAAASATQAATSASNASVSEGNAATSETNAAGSASSAATSAAAAAQSETNAGNSAAAAANSASAAQTSATDAAQSASAAQSSATQAATDAANAATSASQASTSETNAAGSASSAATSATNAANSATQAGNSASAAANSASTASTKASEAATSATAAQTSATQAVSSASAASVSETNAATSASEAAGSAATALSAKEVAVKSIGQGVSPDPVFSAWSGTGAPTGYVFGTSQGSITKNTANAKYGVALDITTANPPTANAPVVKLHSSQPDGTNVTAVLVTLEAELVTGAWQGAIRVAWVPTGTGGTSAITYVPPSAHFVAETGVVQRAEIMVERPATFVAGTGPTEIRVWYSPASTYGDGRAYNKTRIHYFDWKPVYLSAWTSIVQSAIKTVDDMKASALAFRARAGSAGAELELVALSDPANGPVSNARISADNILLDGSVRARKMTIDDYLDINAITGAFRVGKQSAIDFVNDGMYIGRTDDGGGTLGFGFHAGRVSGGVEEYIQHTKLQGLRIKNAKFFIGAGAATSTTYSTSQTVTIPAGTQLLTLEIVGGGGGGGNGQYVNQTLNGPNGPSVTVTLKDGATTVATWTAAGGVGGAGGGKPAPAGWTGQQISPLTPLGDGGPGGAGATIGGGKGSAPVYGANGSPGDAGQYIHIIDYDISALSNPNLILTFGTKAVDYWWGPGAPNAGGVRVQTKSNVDIPAGPVGLKPSATGTFTVSAYTAGSFPVLTPTRGLWMLNKPPTGWRVDPGDGTLIWQNGSVMMFVASNTPTWNTNHTNTKTVRYWFWPM